MIAAAPTASTMHAAAPPAMKKSSAASTATPAGTISPCRTIGFNIALRHVRRSRRRPCRRNEPVPAAANGFDHPVGAERLERHAQAADVHVDRALLDIDVIAPDQVEQLRAAVDALRTCHEETQQAKLRRAKRDLAAADGHAMRDRVERDRARDEDLLRGF